MGKQHTTGYICLLCGAVAVVDIDGHYLCAAHTIETTITVDLRAEEPAVTVSVGRQRQTAMKAIRHRGSGM